MLDRESLRVTFNGHGVLLLTTYVAANNVLWMVRDTAG